MTSPTPEHEDGYFKRGIKRDFLYGLIVVIPIVCTGWLALLSIDFISGPVSSIFGHKVHPFFSFLLTLCIITLIGMLARNIIGRAVIGFFEKLMTRIPIMNTVYKSSKQIVNAFTMQKRRLLSAVLVEYPRPGLWAIGFITREDVSGLVDENGEEMGEGKCAVFIPTTPNPTSGYFLFCKKEEIVRLGISIEDSIKVLMSAGVLSPPKPRRKKPKAS